MAQGRTGKICERVLAPAASQVPFAEIVIERPAFLQATIDWLNCFSQPEFDSPTP